MTAGIEARYDALAESVAAARPSRLPMRCRRVAVQLCAAPAELSRTQQPASVHEQVRQPRRDLQTMQVLGQATVSHLLEPEHALDHPDAVLNLRAHAGLASVHRPDALIDPAAHGGHRETDLAMLALFGLPHLDDVLAAYDDERPLRPGWRRRTALHQLYPVGVHAVLFGGHYVAQLDRLLTSLHA